MFAHNSTKKTSENATARTICTTWRVTQTSLCPSERNHHRSVTIDAIERADSTSTTTTIATTTPIVRDRPERRALTTP